MTLTQLAYLLVGMVGIAFFTWKFALSWNRVENETSKDVGPLVINGIIVALFVAGASTLVYVQFGERIARIALSVNFLLVVAVFGISFVVIRLRDLRGKQKRDVSDTKEKTKGLPSRLLARAKWKRHQ